MNAHIVMNGDDGSMSVVSYCTEQSVIDLFQTVVRAHKGSFHYAACVFIDGKLAASVNVQGVVDHSPLHWGIKQ